jgi:hypothetical protein
MPSAETAAGSQIFREAFMAEYTYEQLRNMTVAQLRQIADGIKHEALEGHSTMHKDYLLPALCKAMSIQIHHVAVGAHKTQVKALVRRLKADRDAALAAGDRAKLANVRRQIHTLKHRLRHMVAPSA